MNQYIAGTNIVLTVNFKSAAGVLTDPTTVTAEVRLPDGTIAALTVAKTAVGIYTANYTPLVNGLFAYRFEGAGALVAAAEGAFVAQTTF